MIREEGGESVCSRAWELISEAALRLKANLLALSACEKGRAASVANERNS